MIFKTEDLIASIKVRALVPVSQQTFTENDLINLINEEMQIGLVPDIQSVKENFFLRTKLVPIVSGQREYTIPERAIGGTIQNLFFKDASGNRMRLTEKKVSDLEFEMSGTGNASGFYLIGDRVRLNAIPLNGNLEFYFYCRPSDLIKTISCAKVTDIMVGATTTVISLDTDITASVTTATLVDIITAKSPNQIKGFDCVVNAIGASNVTIGNSFIQDESGATMIEVGDYVCPAQRSNIPLIPSELHSVLAQMTAARIVEALGDMTKIQMVNMKLQEMRVKATALIANRVESGSSRVVNRRGIKSHIGG